MFTPVEARLHWQKGMISLLLTAHGDYTNSISAQCERLSQVPTLVLDNVLRLKDAYETKNNVRLSEEWPCDFDIKFVGPPDILEYLQEFVDTYDPETSEHMQ